MLIPPSHRTVVAGALDLVEVQGFSMLTMRALGTWLGIRGASLYHWVPSREVLLHDMASLLDEYVIQGLPAAGSPAGEWRGVVRRLVRGVRDVCTQFPRSAPLLIGLPADQRWIRAPRRSAATVEELLSALRRSGFSRPEAVAAYRSVTAFLAGELLFITAGTITDGTISPGRRLSAGLNQPPGILSHSGVGELMTATTELQQPPPSPDSLELLLARLQALRLR